MNMQREGSINGMGPAPPPADMRSQRVASGEIPPESPEDRISAAEAVSLVYRFYDESRNSEKRQQWVRQWQMADRLWRGEFEKVYTKEALLKDWSFTANLIYPDVEKLLSLMVEGFPFTEIQPGRPADAQVVDTLDRYLDNQWERQGWTLALGMTADQAIKHSTSFLKTYWDIHAQGGRGDVRWKPVSNYDIFLHEKAMIEDGQLVSKYVIHRFFMSRNQILSKYNVDVVQAERVQSLKDRAKGVWETVRRSVSSAASSATPRGGDETTQVPKGFYEVLEMLYMDDALVESEDYNQTMTGWQMRPFKYPTGRVITVCNHVRLADTSNAHGFNYFVPLTTAANLHELYPPSILNHMAGSQYAVNKGLNQIHTHTELCANPKARISVETQGANQDSDLTGAGGKVVTHEGELGFSWVQPPQLGGEVLEMIQLGLTLLDEISGVEEVNQGGLPRETSGVGIERLQKAGLTRSNLRLTYFDEGVKTAVRNTCSMFLDFVTEDRQFSYVDSDLARQFATFNGKELVLPSRRAAMAAIEQQIAELTQQFVAYLNTAPTEALAQKGAVEAQVAALRSEIEAVMAMPASDLVMLDVRVQTGTRDFTRAALANLALQLYELGLLPEDDLMKMLRVPNSTLILQKLQQRREQQAASEQKAMKEALAAEQSMSTLEHVQDMDLEEMRIRAQMWLTRIELASAERQTRMKANATAQRQQQRPKED